jgi:hypothetical protein
MGQNNNFKKHILTYFVLCNNTVIVHFIDCNLGYPSFYGYEYSIGLNLNQTSIYD